MFQLKTWKLDGCKGRIIARGNCYGNSRFFEGCHIHTSAIRKAEISEDMERLLVTTQSGSQYTLDFAEIDRTSWESTMENSKVLGLCLNAERCLCLWQQAQKRTIERLEAVLEPCEMYVKINEGLITDEAYYRTKRQEILKVAVHCSNGLFTNSVLVEEYDWHSAECRGGWKYMIWDWGRGISSYFWNNILEAVKVFNDGEDFMIEHFGKQIYCNKHEITTIERGNVQND